MATYDNAIHKYDTTLGQWIPVIAGNAQQLQGKEPAQVNGIATLGSDGKLTAEQLPEIQAMEEHGNEWHNPAFATDADLQQKVGNLNDLQTTTKQNLVAAINEALEFNALTTVFEVDPEDMFGEPLVVDIGAWKGQARSYTQPSSGMAAVTVAYLETNKLRYFEYSAGVRLRCNNSNPVNVVQIKARRWDGTSWIDIETLMLQGDYFPDISNFYVFPLNFHYLNSVDNKLRIEIISQPVANLKIDVDSVVIMPILGAAYGG